MRNNPYEMLKISVNPAHPHGKGYEMILKAFGEPALFELCQPVVYGSMAEAEAQRQQLEAETPLARADKAENMRANRLNVVECDEPSAASRAVEACQSGQTDAVVHASATSLPLAEGTMQVFLTDHVRMVSATQAADAEQAAPALTVESVTAGIQQFNHLLRRDFLLSRPRVAVLSLHATDGREETDVLMPAIENAIDQRINVFGPFPAEEFFAEGDYRAYDGIYALHPAQVRSALSQVNAGYHVSYVADQDDVQTAACGNTELDFLNAIYLATDLLRNRQTFDEAYHDPLQKLYHDKREERK